MSSMRRNPANSASEMGDQLNGLFGPLCDTVRSSTCRTVLMMRPGSWMILAIGFSGCGGVGVVRVPTVLLVADRAARRVVGAGVLAGVLVAAAGGVAAVVAVAAVAVTAASLAGAVAVAGLTFGAFLPS